MNVQLVIKLRNNVKKRVNIEEVAAGLNVRRIIEKAVFDELCAMVDGCVRLTRGTVRLTSVTHASDRMTSCV